jgi:protein-disulfide isomerase
MSEVAVKAMPRRGRFWVLAILAVALFVLVYGLVNIATQKAVKDIVHVEGISETQEIFGGVPQEDDRLGSSDAPVSVQVFSDMQCGSCQEAFLDTIPGLVEHFARPGSAQFLLRHYSVSENALELGFFGAEAAAQQGYGWQFTYLFYRNQDEAKKFQSDKKFHDFMASLAGSIGELDVPEWQEDLETGSESGSAMRKRLESYEALGTGLGIRTEQAFIVNGPSGTKTLQDGPSLAEVEQAIEAAE